MAPFNEVIRRRTTSINLSLLVACLVEGRGLLQSSDEHCALALPEDGYTNAVG